MCYRERWEGVAFGLGNCREKKNEKEKDGEERRERIKRSDGGCGRKRKAGNGEIKAL